MSPFLNILDELASSNKTMSDAEKVTKLLRTHPATFDSLVMVFSWTTNPFEEIVNAVCANIKRKKKLGTLKNENKSLFAHFAKSLSLYQFKNNSKLNRFLRRGRGKFGRTRERLQRHYDDRKVRHYCGKPGNYIKFCRRGLADEHQAFNSLRLPAGKSLCWGSSAFLDNNIGTRSTANEVNDVNFAHTLPSNNRGQRL